MQNTVMVELTTDELAFLGAATLCYRQSCVGNTKGASEGINRAIKYEKNGSGQSALIKLRNATVISESDPENKGC